MHGHEHHHEKEHCCGCDHAHDHGGIRRDILIIAISAVLLAAVWIITGKVSGMKSWLILLLFLVPYLIAGFEVPHTHIHVFPANDMSGFDLSLADPDAPAEESDAAAETLRRSLRELGHGEFVPEA